VLLTEPHVMYRICILRRWATGVNTVDIKILGCYGSSAPGKRTTSFLLNETIAMDAGALTAALSIEEQSRISHIFLSHSHIDHLASLPFLMDNIFSDVRRPVSLFGPEHTIRCLKSHLFNDQLWPDFTELSNGHSSIMQLQQINAGTPMEVCGLKITPAPLDHTVECYGYLLEEERASLFVCGDTRSIDRALPLIKSTPNLKALVLESSFPNRMKHIAELSRHLTPATFVKEAGKLPESTRILVTHMKPDCAEEIKGELIELGLKNVSLLEQGKTYTF